MKTLTKRAQRKFDCFGSLTIYPWPHTHLSPQHVMLYCLPCVSTTYSMLFELVFCLLDQWQYALMFMSWLNFLFWFCALLFALFYAWALKPMVINNYFLLVKVVLQFSIGLLCFTLMLFYFVFWLEHQLWIVLLKFCALIFVFIYVVQLWFSPCLIVWPIMFVGVLTWKLGMKCCLANVLLNWVTMKVKTFCNYCLM